MKHTVAEMLDWLEKPENEAQISHLAHLKNVEHVDEIKNIGGASGVISRLVLRFTQKYTDALLVLSECKTADDIAAFKKTAHYEKIKDTEIGAQLSDLSELKNLEQLKTLGSDLSDI